MRSMYSKDELLIAAAKKKPRLQALIDRVQDMTLGEIDNLSEVLWIRESLKILKESNGKGQKDRIAELIEDCIRREKEAIDIPKPTYEVRLWDIDEYYIGGDGSNDREWKIQIEKGDSLLIVDESYIKVGDSMIYLPDYNRYFMFASSNLLGYMTLDAYKGFNRALINQKHKL